MLPIFTDQKIQLMGTCRALLMNPGTGTIDFASDTFSTAQITTSASENIIRSGLGNGIVSILTTDKDVSVNFQADEFSLPVKAMNFGSATTYGAPVMVCQTIAATGATLSIPLTSGTPVAGVGREAIECYVMPVGAAADIATYGTPYTVDPSTGLISGFAATSGTTYKVFYYVTRANAEVATLSAAGEPFTEYFMAQIAGYKNVVKGATGTRAGWLYVIVPLLHFGGANAGIDGSQTTPDNSMIVGRALRSNPSVVSATCDDCEGGSGDLAYYIWVPDDEAENVQALAVVGGVIVIGAAETTHIIDEFRLVVGNSLVKPDPAYITYALQGDLPGVSLNGNVITKTGSNSGELELLATYNDGTNQFDGYALIDVEG